MGTVRPAEGHYLVAPLVPELLAWVEVNGEPLQVYGAEVSGNKAIGYIEAKEGQQFKVRYLDNRPWQSRPGQAYVMRLCVDGSNLRGFITRLDDGLFRHDAYSKDRVATFSGLQTSEGFEHPFLFSKLVTTDSDALACSDEQIIKNLGTLQLRYIRATNVRPCVKPVFENGKASLIHERAKKAQLSHQANFGEAVPIKPIPNPTTDYIDSIETPFLSIEFRYRSRQLLQLEGYIPHSPAASPEPSPTLSPSVSIPPAPAQAQASSSPVASTSNLNRSGSSAQPSQSSQAQSPDHERIARLEAELESLRRQERIAALERELDGLKGGNGVSGSAGSSSSDRKIKAEPSDDQREAKKVKRELGEASFAANSQSSAKGKGKEKRKPDVIELSDSD
ncbi:uncharacterized protein JCM6883_003981 [Sporobolomyces salmoneus]|uniref:uncharacterized protein n=1 Tax=Sporobolomyces salmoneus TaxID=183962 RepID=UPI003170E3D7